MNETYVQQVRLLLRILPEINKIDEFALHGGTAINLFYHNMPRLSVDIDLTYIPFGDRNTDLKMISKLLNHLSNRLMRTIPGISLKSGSSGGDEVKLFCKLNTSEVKIEVNTINRGLMDLPSQKYLCMAAQERFNTWCEIKTVPIEQLFGGKIVAALDRQHPRDLFDIKKLMEYRSIDTKMLIGFLFCAFSSKRPLDEILQPNPMNYNHLINNQFLGMTNEAFTIETYETVRAKLISTIISSLSKDQKTMILNFAETNPVWLYGDWGSYPGIAWKIKNLVHLKETNPSKFQKQIEKLKSILF
ncbi:MAG: nucleotidyl transferase AbiEii/AbiGii toxin family protein [Bacteroidetes bacterium]|nr:MAG: nucleotidyl transferase AbiEii/AbiGii toxin family protein [Bacteroidota bacterium]